MNENREFRSFVVDPESSRAVLTTERPVPMFDWQRGEMVPEVLLMSAMEVRGAREQVPLLDTHSRQTVDDVLGSVREIEHTGAEIRGEVTFDDGDAGARAKAKVDAGHITDLSVGYQIDPNRSQFIPDGERAKVNGQEFAGPVNVRTWWQLQEVSLVPIGADEMAKIRGFESVEDAKRKLSETKSNAPTASGDADPVGRGEGSRARTEDVDENQPAEAERSGDKSERKNITMSDTSTVDEAELRAIRENAAKAEVERIDKIRKFGDELATKHNDPDTWNGWARELIDEGVTAAEAQRAFEACSRFQSGAVDSNAQREGQSEQAIPETELRSYSLFDAIRGAESRNVTGLEREVSDEIARKVGRTAKPNSFFLPTRAVSPTHGSKRDLTINPDTATELVGTDHRGDMFIELLRNRQALPRTGMRTIGGLRGDIAIPKLSAAGTAYWLADEATAITESTQTFAQVTGSPKELGASTDISRKTLAQSSPDAEMIVRDDLATILALAKDAAGLQGTGTNGQPTGIASGATSVTTSANAPTWAQIVAFETAVASANADVENMAWVFDAAVRGNLKSIEKDSGGNYPIYLMGDNNTLAGYPVVVSNQMTGGLGLFGNFSDAMFLDWEGVEVIVDEISLARERLVRVTVCLMTDVIVRHDESFAISSADMDATA